MKTLANSRISRRHALNVDLSKISTRALSVLQRKLEHWDTADKTLSTKDLRSWGLENDADIVLKALHAVDKVLWHTLVSVALSERQRPIPQIEVSWTGDTTSRQPRDTRLVVKQLFSEAKARIVLAVYSYDDAEVFKHLKAAAIRGVAIDIYLDIQQNNGPLVERDEVKRQVNVFLAKWRGLSESREEFTGQIFYDKRVQDGELFLSLHAKCVIVDARHVYVGSANFTTRGNERNTEVGLLVDDPDTAQRLLQILQGGSFIPFL